MLGEEWRRIVIGLDPPASTHGDSCGIVVCALDEDRVAYVLADLTQGGLSPEAWARRVVDAADLYGATRVVAEKNQGGEMIASVLRAVDANLPVKLVHAGPSRATRAEPIALRFETGRAKLAGHFPELEEFTPAPVSRCQLRARQVAGTYRVLTLPRLSYTANFSRNRRRP